MLRQTQVIGGGRFLNAPFQSRPAGETVLPRDRELCVAEAQLCIEDRRVSSSIELPMKFSDALGSLRIARGMRLEQIFRLILEMIEIGARRQAFYWHTNFLSWSRLGPHLQAESEFVF